MLMLSGCPCPANNDLQGWEPGTPDSPGDLGPAPDSSLSSDFAALSRGQMEPPRWCQRGSIIVNQSNEYLMSN